MHQTFTFNKFLRRSFLFLLCWSFTYALQAQTTFGNEWINYSQTYYKIPIVKKGIFRLDYNYLSAAGLSGEDPRKFQIFRRGKELSVFVQGENDGRLDNEDYIEFYGEPNDGKTDVELYKSPSYKVHDLYSLYTDTAAYFLTVSPENGKRMRIQNLSAAGLTAEDWHWQTRLVLHTNSYSRGYTTTNSTQLPYGDKVEGFFSGTFGIGANGVNRGSPKIFPVDSLINLETSGPNPSLETIIIGDSFVDHNITISIVLPGGGERILQSNLTLGKFDHVKTSYPLQFSDINASGVLNVKFNINTKVTAGELGDMIRIGYLKVTYPRKNILSEKDLYISLPDSSKASNSFLSFATPLLNSVAYDLTDQSNISRTEGIAAAEKQGFVFEGNAGRKRSLLVTNRNRFSVPAIPNKINFRQFDPGKPNYIIISHRKLTATALDYPQPINAYAAYRASEAGGKYDTLVFYSDQLYNQFHYGDRSAVAIRRFMKFLMASGKPEQLFLIGKGVEPDYGLGKFRINPNAYPVQDLVPTGGTPGSDVLFTADFQNNVFYPQVPTGRLAATNSAEVVGYLEKVMQNESLSDNEVWRKNVLHLGGGINTNQQIQFKNYLASYENIIKRPLLGANVQTISKLGLSTAATININVSQQVNAGLSLITFFGHSSSSITDIDIGSASSPINGYNNLKKYPMILVNGCNAGYIFSASLIKSFGEDWMLTPKKGAILFIAHSGAGLDIPLHVYSRNFYNIAFNEPDFYGKPIGLINQEVIKRTANINNEEYIGVATEMVLQGDPAIRLFAPAKPDLAIERSTISFRSLVPKQAITAASDSFQIVIPVKNLGKATEQSFYVSVSRNNQVLIDSVLSRPVYAQDTIYFNFKSTEGKVAGINRFDIMVDHLNQIDELDETNNIVSQFEYNFPANGASPLFPEEYAIVNTEKVKLIGQAVGSSTQDRSYFFELDTTQTFNSPVKRSQVVSSADLPTWEVTLLPNVAPHDSLVYYWRYRINNSVPTAEDSIWGESSFRYIPNSPPGWSQSQPAQFAQAQKSQINLNQSTNQWEFSPIEKSLSLRTTGNIINTDWLRYGIFVNSLNGMDGTCILNIPNLIVAVFKEKTLEPYLNMPGGVPNSVCGVAPKSFYYFGNLNDPNRREHLLKFLEAVPAGYYVAAVTLNQVPFANFSPELKDAFHSIGSKLIDELPSGYPFAIVGQKGAAVGSAQEITATAADPTESIELNYTLTGNGNTGKITSTLIGPATEWKTLYHTIQQQATGKDRYNLVITGLDINQKNETVLQQNITEREKDISAIDAKNFPYLQLSAVVSDSLEATAPQLKEWLVLYTGVPEGIVRPDLVGMDKYAELSKQADKGKIEVKFAFENISDVNFSDSILTRITLIGQNGFTKDIKIKPLAKGEVAYVQHTFATAELTGNYTLRFTANPTTDNPIVQPEKYYFNNSLEVPLTINANLHPLLDVVFDGRHIMNGEIVSPNPKISMTLQDDDTYSFLQDPNNMEVFLKMPDQIDYTAVDLTNQNIIQYTPATEKNDFKLNYSPENLPDGKYTLQVQGKDLSGNKAGFEPYTIEFEVINESSVTHFYPYPNPFSSKTRFVYTLTGSKVPDNMKIQIMTITGKVVREITKEELEPIKIGNNISDFAWDGTDEFGDRLANGVYLYRVVMDTGDNEFKNRKAGTSGKADQAFKKEYGKIYILR